MNMHIIDSSEKLISNTQTILLGISINNSYFKESNLEKIIKWSKEYGKNTYIMIPDEPAVHTMIALGASSNDAERKARLKSNSLENKCRVLIECLGVEGTTIIRWGSLAPSLLYLESLCEIKYAYDHDPLFQERLRSATKEVLVANGCADTRSSVLDDGVVFLLKELAFIARADVILSEPKVLYVYHKTMAVLKEIIQGRYMFKPSAGVGFLTVS